MIIHNSDFYTFIVLHSVAAQMPLPYSTDLESSLRESLFTGYDVLQKPRERVDVNVALSLMRLNYMDIKAQTFSIFGYFSLSWHDDRLTWLQNVTHWSVRLLFSNEKYMWVPPVILENGINDILPLGSEKVFTKISLFGSVSWLPGGNYETNCESQVTFYPLDTQTCTITLTTMSYTMNQVRLNFSEGTAIDKSGFTENGEWDILSITTTNSVAYLEEEPYSRLHFVFKLRRRPLYHILNTLFPVILMASLTVFVFKLSPESGERIGMSLTVLLAYAVYLSLISDNIPQTSKSVSILSIYLSIILVLSALSVVLTISMLDVYFKPEEDTVPNWLQSFTHSFLVRVTCWNATCSSQGKVVPNSNDVIAVSNASRVLRDTSELDNVDSGKKIGMNNANRSHQELKRTYNWKEIALMLDKSFMYIFILLVVIITVVSLAVLGLEYKRI